jgi:hypothetical protein
VKHTPEHLHQFGQQGQRQADIASILVDVFHYFLYLDIGQSGELAGAKPFRGIVHHSFAVINFTHYSSFFTDLQPAQELI